MKTITRHILFSDSKSNQTGHVSCKEVTATRFQIPVFVFTEEIKPSSQKLSLRLSSGVKLCPGFIKIIQKIPNNRRIRITPRRSRIAMGGAEDWRDGGEGAKGRAMEISRKRERLREEG
jgi:hypothetical protein